MTCRASTALPSGGEPECLAQRGCEALVADPNQRACAAASAKEVLANSVPLKHSNQFLKRQSFPILHPSPWRSAEAQGW